MHVLGRLNQRADMLSWGSRSPGEWSLFRRQLLLPSSFLKGTGCAGIRMTQGPPVCLSPSHSTPSGHKMDQGERMHSSTSGSTLVKPVVVAQTESALIDSSLVDSASEGFLQPML